jgi:hypothetical protein
MNLSDLEPGKAYIVAGQGELLLVLIHEKTPVFAGHGSHTGSYYANLESVVRKATAEDIKRRYEMGKSRGVACDDRDCWCKDVKDTVREPEQVF